METQEITNDFEGHVDVNGIKIHYEYFGKKDRPAIIIFNGVAMQTKSWTQFLPHMVDKLDVLLWDFRGQGESNSDDQLYSIEEFADYLKAIVDELELKPELTNLVGISSGTIVQAEFMRKYPKAFNKVLMAGVLLTSEKIFQLQNIFAINTMKTDVGLWVESLYCMLFSDYFVRATEQYIPNMKAALVERYKDRVHALSRIMEAQNNYIAAIDKYHADYAKIKSKVLVIAGAEDRITPPYYQKRVLDLYPDTEYKEFEKVGHMVVMEKPKEFFEEVKNYVL